MSKSTSQIYYRASNYNIVEPINGGRFAIYNTASGAFVIVSKYIWKTYVAGSREVLARSGPSRELVRRGIIVPIGYDELASVRLNFERARYTAAEFVAVVVPTMGCNLKCPYCFEGQAQERPGHKAMTRSIEADVIRWIACAVREHDSIHIVWYGGEPLLALHSVERITAVLEPALSAAKKNYSASILTNGTKLTDDTAIRLAACKIGSAQISVDVPASPRNDAAGDGTREAALDGAVSCMKQGIRVNLRVNVLTADEKEFDALYSELESRGLQKSLGRLEFHHVRTPEAQRSGAGSYLAPLKLADFENAMARERRKVLAKGISSSIMNFSKHALCMAVRDSSAVIGPDGRLYKCMEEVGLVERSHGSVIPGHMTENEKLIPWLTYDWFSHNQCKECVFLPQCGGGCPHRRLFAPELLHPSDFCFSEITANIRDRMRLFVEFHDSQGDISSCAGTGCDGECGEAKSGAC